MRHEHHQIPGLLETAGKVRVPFLRRQLEDPDTELKPTNVWITSFGQAVKSFVHIMGLCPRGLGRFLGRGMQRE